MIYMELLENKNIADGLLEQKIDKPTLIQENSYKPILENKNIIARSETGSGKTLAYLVPIIEKINISERALNTIILVPTYELAMQVHKQIELLCKNSQLDIRSVPIIGNGNINRQIEQLKSKPHIIVGTSGRIHELIKKKKISAHTVKTLVIDEADKMMDKNNLLPLKDVRKCLYKNIQILMYSASMNKKTLAIAQTIAVDAIILKTAEKETIPDNIKHLYVITTRSRKTETLRSICSALKPEKCMIFVNTQYDTNEVYEKMTYHKYKIDCLTGENNKIQRKKAIENINNGKSNYLISTDVASRGLHIDNVSTVINYNLPTDPKDYLHRAGRCGRNSQNGICISIITENELSLIKSYQKSFKVNFLKKKLFKGTLVQG